MKVWVPGVRWPGEAVVVWLEFEVEAWWCRDRRVDTLMLVVRE